MLTIDFKFYFKLNLKIYTLKETKNVPSAEIWMDLGTVIQSEVSQKEENKYV